MAKITLKGIITDVSTPERVGTNGTVMQSIIVFKRGWVDDFGTKKQPDEEWQLDIFNNKIEEFAIGQDFTNKKVEVEFYSSSRRIAGRDGKNDWFSISNRLAKCTVIGDAERPNDQPPGDYFADVATQTKEDDDLPF